MTTPSHKHQPFRFSLRALLVFVLVLSLPLGWFTWFARKLQKVRMQRELVEVVLEAGGSVVYDYEVDENGESVDAAREMLPNDFFCEVVLIRCGSTEFGDDDARLLKGMTKLESLLLGGTGITDNGLVHLEGLTRLKFLSLGGTQVTDEGVKTLQRALPDCSIEH